MWSENSFHLCCICPKNECLASPEDCIIVYTHTDNIPFLRKSNKHWSRGIYPSMVYTYFRFSHKLWAPIISLTLVFDSERIANNTTTYPTPSKNLIFSCFYVLHSIITQADVYLYSVCVCVWFIDSVDVILPCPIHILKPNFCPRFFPRPLYPINPYII